MSEQSGLAIRERFSCFVSPGDTNYLQRLLQECLSVKAGELWLEFVSFSLEPSANAHIELMITLRLILFETGDDLVQKIVSFKDQELSLGHFPSMTDGGSFLFNGEAFELKPQRALPSGLYFSREGANTTAHIVFARLNGDTMGCAALEITRHRRGDLSIHLRADPRLPASSLFPKIEKKKDLPARFQDAGALCDWMRLHAAPAFVNKSATREEIAAQQDSFSRSCCSLIARQQKLWLSLETLPEGLRLAEHIVDSSGNLIVPQGALVSSYLETLRSHGLTEVTVTQASLHLFIATEDGYDPLTGEVLFECGQALHHGYRLLSAEHKLTLSAVYCAEDSNPAIPEDVWRMSRVGCLSPRGDGVFIDELTRAIREERDFERHDALIDLVTLCCWLLDGLSKTKGLFLAKPDELPLFDTLDVFAQLLWESLQRVRGNILQRFGREQDKAALIPSDLVHEGELSTYLLAAFKARA